MKVKFGASQPKPQERLRKRRRGLGYANRCNRQGRAQLPQIDWYLRACGTKDDEMELRIATRGLLRREPR
jgi:hypothetical protein